MKTCSKCNKEKDLEEFHRNNSRKDGRQGVCKPCRSVYHKSWYSDPIKNREQADRSRAARKKRREAYHALILDYLLEHPCVDCGITDIRVLDFDHLPGFQKEISISDTVAFAWSPEQILAEISKCDVRCRNCHAIVTYERDGSWRHTAYLSNVEQPVHMEQGGVR